MNSAIFLKQPLEVEAIISLILKQDDIVNLKIAPRQNDNNDTLSRPCIIDSTSMTLIVITAFGHLFKSYLVKIIYFQVLANQPHHLSLIKKHSLKQVRIKPLAEAQSFSRESARLMVHSNFRDCLTAFGDSQLPADSHSACRCMQLPCTASVRMHCGSQLAADCHRIHSYCDKNFVGRRSLEKLYEQRSNSPTSDLRQTENHAAVLKQQKFIGMATQCSFSLLEVVVAGRVRIPGQNQTFFSSELLSMFSHWVSGFFSINVQ